MYKIWDRNESIILTDGRTYTPDEIMNDMRFGFTKYLTTVLRNVVENGNAVTLEVNSLAVMLEDLGLDPDLQGEDAIDAISYAREAQKGMVSSAVMREILKAVPVVVAAVNEHL